MLLAAIVSFGAFAQGHENLRITEVMIAPDSTSGAKCGWLELYNSSYGTYHIEKVFITTQKAESLFTEQNKKAAAKEEKIEENDAVLRYLSRQPGSNVYVIPRGDERNTTVAPRGQVVFQADGNTAAGTFHLPFTFEPGQYIAIYDVNGELLDEVTVPETLPAGHSWALSYEGRKTLPKYLEEDQVFEERDGSTLEKAITPGNFNARDANENIDKFAKHDPHGYIIAFTAIGIVFSALLLLFILFWLFGVVSKAASGKTDEPKASSLVSEPVEAPAAAASADEEEIAAICMAMFQHFNAHDEESGVITFNRNTNTAWSSKQELLRKLPR